MGEMFWVHFTSSAYDQPLIYFGRTRLGVWEIKMMSKKTWGKYKGPVGHILHCSKTNMINFIFSIVLLFFIFYKKNTVWRRKFSCYCSQPCHYFTRWTLAKYASIDFTRESETKPSPVTANAIQKYLPGLHGFSPWRTWSGLKVSVYHSNHSYEVLTLWTLLIDDNSNM